MKVLDLPVFYIVYALLCLRAISDVKGQAHSYLNPYSFLSYLGTADVNDYASRNGGDRYSRAQNTMCAKVSYPNLLTMPAFVDDAIRRRTAYYAGVYRYEYPLPFHMLVASNRRGKADVVEISSPASAYGFGFDNIEEESYVCVFREPAEEGEANVAESHIHVDWLVGVELTQNLRSHVSTIMRTVESAFDVGCSLHSRTRGNELSFLSSFVVVDNGAGHPNMEVSSWVDGLDGRQVKICSGWNNAGQISQRVTRFNVTWILAEPRNAFNVGVDENGDFAVEYGSMQLDFIDRNNETTWQAICVDKAFEKSFGAASPLLFTTLSFNNKRNFALTEPVINTWVEYVNHEGFRVCATQARYGAGNQNHEDVALPFINYLVTTRNGFKDLDSEARVRRHRIVRLDIKFPQSYDWDKVKNEYLNYDSPIAAYVHQAFSGNEKFKSFALIDYPTYGFYSDDAGRQFINFVGFPSMSNAADHDEMQAIFDEYNTGRGNKFSPHGISEYYARRFMELLYPEGEDTTDDQLADLTVSYYDGCVTEAFSTGSCSAGSCSSSDNSGKMTINRGHTGSEVLCPQLQIQAQCNLPPCSVSVNVERFAVEKEVPEPASNIGIIAGAAGGGAAVVVIVIVVIVIKLNSPKKNMSSPSIRQSFGPASSKSAIRSKFHSPASDASSLMGKVPGSAGKGGLGKGGLGKGALGKGALGKGALGSVGGGKPAAKPGAKDILGKGKGASKGKGSTNLPVGQRVGTVGSKSFKAGGAKSWV